MSNHTTYKLHHIQVTFEECVDPLYGGNIFVQLLHGRFKEQKANIGDVTRHTLILIHSVVFYLSLSYLPVYRGVIKVHLAYMHIFL